MAPKKAPKKAGAGKKETGESSRRLEVVPDDHNLYLPNDTEAAIREFERQKALQYDIMMDDPNADKDYAQYLLTLDQEGKSSLGNSEARPAEPPRSQKRPKKDGTR